MHDIRVVQLRREETKSACRFNPRVESIDENHPPRGRPGRGTEKGVLTPRSNPGNSAGGEAAEPVCFEPFVIFHLGQAVHCKPFFAEPGYFSINCSA
jgi:hypothetical protein